MPEALTHLMQQTVNHRGGGVRRRKFQTNAQAAVVSPECLEQRLLLVTNVNLASFQVTQPLAGSIQYVGEATLVERFQGGDYVRLTPDEFNKVGTIIVPNVGHQVKSFDWNLRYRMRTFQAGEPSDGVSVGFGQLSGGAFGANGQPATGVWVRANMFTRSVQVIYNGSILSSTSINPNTFAEYGNINIDVTSGGKLTVFNESIGTKTFNLSNWNPPSSWRFGVGASTGGRRAFHTIEAMQLTERRINKPDINIANAPNVSEGNTASFKITLDETTDVPVSVSYATKPGTAGTSDYVAKSGSVTFSPWQTSKTVTIATREDSIDELTERFTVELSSPTSTAKIGDGSAFVDIIDDDPTPQLRIAPTGQSLGTMGNVSEGNTASYTVSLDRQSSRDITVAYATSEGSAIVDDFTGTSGTLTFSAGQTSKTVTVTTLVDNIFEGNETFSMTLSNPSSTAVLSSSYRTSTFSIVDDDPVPSITITPNPAVEGDDDGSDPLSFDVTLSNPSSQSISVDYATADDTATAGNDYVSRSGTLNFAPLATSQSFTVALIGDDLDEGASESFLVNLSNPSNATIALGQAAGTITDDDFTPVAVGITGGAVQYTIDEGDGLSVSAADTTDGD